MTATKPREIQIAGYIFPATKQGALQAVKHFADDYRTWSTGKRESRLIKARVIARDQYGCSMQECDEAAGKFVFDPSGRA